MIEVENLDKMGVLVTETSLMEVLKRLDQLFALSQGMSTVL